MFYNLMHKKPEENVNFGKYVYVIGIMAMLWDLHFFESFINSYFKCLRYLFMYLIVY